MSSRSCTSSSRSSRAGSRPGSPRPRASAGSRDLLLRPASSGEDAVEKSSSASGRPRRPGGRRPGGSRRTGSAGRAARRAELVERPPEGSRQIPARPGSIRVEALLGRPEIERERDEVVHLRDRPRVLREVDRLDVAAAGLARLDADGRRACRSGTTGACWVLLEAGGAEDPLESPLAAAERAAEHPAGALHLAAVPARGDPRARLRRTGSGRAGGRGPERRSTARKHLDVRAEDRAREVVLARGPVRRPSRRAAAFAPSTAVSSRRAPARPRRAARARFGARSRRPSHAGSTNRAASSVEVARTAAPRRARPRAPRPPRLDAVEARPRSGAAPRRPAPARAQELGARRAALEFRDGRRSALRSGGTVSPVTSRYQRGWCRRAHCLRHGAARSSSRTCPARPRCRGRCGTRSRPRSRMNVKSWRRIGELAARAAGK